MLRIAADPIIIIVRMGISPSLVLAAITPQGHFRSRREKGAVPLENCALAGRELLFVIARRLQRRDRRNCRQRHARLRISQAKCPLSPSPARWRPYWDWPGAPAAAPGSTDR